MRIFLLWGLEKKVKKKRKLTEITRKYLETNFFLANLGYHKMALFMTFLNNILSIQRVQLNCIESRWFVLYAKMRTNHVKIVLNFETSVLRKTRRKKNAFFTWQLWFKFLTLPRKGSKFLSSPGRQSNACALLSRGEGGMLKLRNEWNPIFQMKRYQQLTAS